MKFEYEGLTGSKECVAYIDDDGYLRMKGSNETENLCFTPGGKFWSDACYDEDDAVKKFYPGDKITITF